MTGDGTLLKVDGLTKAYPGVVANDHVSFSVRPGEVHALLGENGAGKSTLVKMIYGLVRPDYGRMTFNGAPYAPETPHAARRTGVAMVFQHFSLFEALTVAENVALGMENPPPQRQLSARIREVSETYGLPLDPNRLVGDLSAGERQRVEIIRCLLQDPKLLIMDEPTSVLTPQEVGILFETLRKLSHEGTAILYISHKLEEIRSLCEGATILRLGKVVATCDPREKSARELAELMVGQTLLTPSRAQKPASEVALKVENLSVASMNPFGTTLKGVTFEVRKGEVLGIGGVAGNGQDELLLALSGEIRAPATAIRVGRHARGRARPLRPPPHRPPRRARGAAGPRRRPRHEPDGERAPHRADPREPRRTAASSTGARRATSPNASSRASTSARRGRSTRRARSPAATSRSS